MAQMDDRMKLIGSAILTQAQQEARALIDKANEIRDNEIAACEEEIVNMMYGAVQDKTNNIRVNSIKSIAKIEVLQHRNLLLHRDGKTKEVFDDVSARLTQYTKTAGYSEKMMEVAKGLKTGRDHSESTVLVSAGDEKTGKDIANILGCQKVEIDPEIKIGGFKVLDTKARVLFDETLDEKLEENRLWYLQNCNLKII